MWILLPLLIGGALGATPVTITNHWYGGFEGDFTIAGEVNNWKVHLVFDHPINKLEVDIFNRLSFLTINDQVSHS